MLGGSLLGTGMQAFEDLGEGECHRPETAENPGGEPGAWAQPRRGTKEGGVLRRGGGTGRSGNTSARKQHLTGI